MRVAILFLISVSFNTFASKPLELDELVETCERLNNNPQLKKFSSKISCQGYKTDWIEIESDYVTYFEKDFFVTSNISMKGNDYNVEEESLIFKLPNSHLNCTLMKEIRYEMRPVSITLKSCEDLKRIQREGRGQFCVNVFQNVSLKSLKIVETGRILSNCN